MCIIHVYTEQAHYCEIYSLKAEEFISNPLCISLPYPRYEYSQIKPMKITPHLPFLIIHNPFTNERISVYLDKHSRMTLKTKDYFVKQISYLSKGVVIVASALCRFDKTILSNKYHSSCKMRRSKLL